MGGAPESEPAGRRGGGLFRKLDFTFRGRKKSCSHLKFVSDSCRLWLPAWRNFPQKESALHMRDSVIRVKAKPRRGSC